MTRNEPLKNQEWISKEESVTIKMEPWLMVSKKPLERSRMIRNYQKGTKSWWYFESSKGKESLERIMCGDEWGTVRKEPKESLKMVSV